jgi:nicotinamidase/pyrazinamidase
MDIFVDVDTQRDFCQPDGALAVKGAPNALYGRLVGWAVDNAVPIVGSVDSHAFDAWEFASSGKSGPAGENPRFPDHCVKGTAGWLKIDGTLPPRYRFVPNVAFDPSGLAGELCTGKNHALYFEKEVYSLFANPNAEAVLRGMVVRMHAPRFVVWGVATDFCVKAAALGLRERGWDTAVLTDAIAPVTEAGGVQALEELRAAGIALLSSAEIL